MPRGIRIGSLVGLIGAVTRVDSKFSSTHRVIRPVEVIMLLFRYLGPFSSQFLFRRYIQRSNWKSATLILSIQLFLSC